MRKDQLLFAICFAMFIQFGFLVITGLVEHHPLPSVHGLLGITLTASMAVHLLLHGRWIVGAIQKYNQMPVPVRTNLLLDFILFGGYLACGLTGLLASVVPFGLASLSHRLTVGGVIIVQVIHLARHWKWIEAAYRRSFLSAGQVSAK